MKILVVMPHYYYAQSEGARFRSLRPSALEPRTRMLDEVVGRLQLYFGGKAFGAIHDKKSFIPIEGVDQIDLRIVTVKDRHLLTHARIPAESFTHVQVDIDPLTLGFHAHTILQENAGKYDYYVYLEDDILIEDPDLFLKIGYLNRAATQAGITNALFQPQRYESALGLGAREKQLYNAIVMDYQTELRASERVLAAEYLGRRVHFEVTTLPHAGCFFLNEQQLNTLVGKENFGHLDRMWVTPLDTAATYAIGMNFKVYKPVLSDYLFLAVRHGCEVISDKLESGHLRIENGRPVGWLNK